MFVVARLGVLALMVAAATAAVSGPWARGAEATAGPPPGHRSPERGSTLALSVALAGGMVSLAVLAWAFLTEDWRFATVVGHARPDVPWTLRVAAIWAGPEGSLLLWTTVLAAAALVTRRLAVSILPGRLLAAITAAYGLVLVTVADPFERLAAPPGAGNGLQPVLEHPAMLWHPPVLYLGLIALLIPSVLFVDREPDQRPRSAVGWTLPAALALLAAGLATGSNWAYVELGWGGYWAWDPIENAGLVAWLAGAALLHRTGSPPDPIGVDRIGADGTEGDRGAPWPRSVTVLGVVPGLAAVWATTITRTGVLNSVHSFANRPTLRLMLLAIAGAFTVAVLWLALGNGRGPGPSSATAARTPRSTAGFVAVGLAAVVVAVGTYEPALETLVRDRAFTVSGRFYSLLLWPIAVAGSTLRVRAVLGAEPTSRTRSASTGANGTTLSAAVVGAVGAMMIVTADVGVAGLALAAAGGAVAASSLLDPGAIPAGGRSRLAHLGIGVLMVGVAGTMAATTDTVVVLTDAEASTPVGVVVHRGVDIVSGDGTTEAVAAVELTVDGRTETFHPRLVSYPATGGESSEVDTDRGWLTDFQVTLIDADATGATYRISRHPRMSLVWLGAALTTVGLAATAVARRRNRLQSGTVPAVP